MKNYHKFIFIFICSLSLGTAFARELFELKKMSYSQEGSRVEIKFETAEEISGPCTLIVENFTYLPAVQTISITAARDSPCLIDSFGKAVGSFQWMAPKSFLNSGVQTKIVLNGKLVGVLP